ncbi:MAG: hypothetical protein FD135_1888 [Comamonadaceae bacterium]|nr:MAG: hypothetical protein FD135_1888 [Comamonadaceae bacterium]
MSQPSDEVLGMAVHSLPTPGAAAGTALSGRMKLLAILLACSFPVLVAYFVFYVVRPHGEAAFGELITPVHPVADVLATDLEGRPVPLPALKGQWLLVKVDGGACVQDCQKQLTVLRQFRLMLAKDMERVDWLWLINDQAPVDAKLAELLKRDRATVLRLEPQVLSDWLPMDSAAAAKAKRDMEHLLRASLAWDAPGR